MACGDRYSHLIVTPNHGYTPQNTYGWYAVPWDVTDWRALVDDLTLRAISEVQRLKQLSEEKEAEGELVDELRSRLELLEKRAEAIPSGSSVYWLTGPEQEQHIAAAVAATKEATCILELADDGLKALGSAVKTPGASNPSATPKMETGWFLGIGLGLAALWAYNKYGGDD